MRKEAPYVQLLSLQILPLCELRERSGHKWYCEWYRIYVDPDELTECSHYQG